MQRKVCFVLTAGEFYDGSRKHRVHQAERGPVVGKDPRHERVVAAVVAGVEPATGPAGRICIPRYPGVARRVGRDPVARVGTRSAQVAAPV